MALTYENWILSITLIVTILFHIIFILIARSERRYQRFHDVTQRLLDIGTSIKDHEPKHYLLWDSAVLNQCEYVSYLINKNKIDFKFTAGFLEDALIQYYEGIILKRYEKKLTDKKYYPEFRSLYHRLKQKQLKN